MKTTEEQLTYAIKTNEIWVSKFNRVSEKLAITVEALKTVKNRVASRNVQIEKDEGELLISICREALKKIKAE